MFKLFVFNCLFLNSLMSSAQVYVTHSDGRPLRLQPGTNFMFGSSSFDIKADDVVDGRRLRLSISSIHQNSTDVLLEVNRSSPFSECEIDWSGSQNLKVSFNRIQSSYVMDYYFTVEIINSGEQKFTQYALNFASGYGLDEGRQPTYSEGTFSPVSEHINRRQRVYDSPYQRKGTNNYRPVDLSPEPEDEGRQPTSSEGTFSPVKEQKNRRQRVYDSPSKRKGTNPYRPVELSPEPEPVEYDSNSMLPYSVKIQAKIRKAQHWSNGYGLSALGKSRRVVIKFPPHLASNAVDVTLDLKNAKEATAKALSLENKTGTALFSSNGGREQLHFDSAGCIEFLITYDGEAKKVIGQEYELTIRMRNHSTVIYDKKLDIVAKGHHYESKPIYSAARAEAGKGDIDLLMGLK